MRKKEGKQNYFPNFSPKFSSLPLCVILLPAQAILFPCLQWSRNQLLGVLQKHQWLYEYSLLAVAQSEMITIYIKTTAVEINTIGWACFPAQSNFISSSPSLISFGSIKFTKLMFARKGGSWVTGCHLTWAMLFVYICTTVYKTILQTI